ncbi:hypothetical protein [Mycolicibacter sinensis]
MTDSETAAASAGSWDFSTLAYLWDAPSRAIVAGADQLKALSDAEREQSVAALSQRVGLLASALDDRDLMLIAAVAVDDVYKSCFQELFWGQSVADYLAATAGVVVQELERRGVALHYVISNALGDADLHGMLTGLPAVFSAAGLFVVGPQVVALYLMEQSGRPRDVDAIPRYRDEGQIMADELIERCHRERRSSLYLHIDVGDTATDGALNVAVPRNRIPGALVVYRDEAPVQGSLMHAMPPPGIDWPAEFLRKLSERD